MPSPNSNNFNPDEHHSLRWLHIFLILAGLAIVLPSAYYLQRRIGRQREFSARMKGAARHLEKLRELESSHPPPGIAKALEIQHKAKELRNDAKVALANANNTEVKAGALELLAEAEQRLAPHEYVIHNISFVNNTDLGIDGERLPESPRSYRISARYGQDLRISVRGRIFRYPIGPDTPEELHFRISGYFYHMNNKLVGIELEGKAARSWLVSARPEELENIVYLCIGKMSAKEISSLEKINNDSLIIDVTEGHLDNLLPILPKLNPLALGVDESPTQRQIDELAKITNLRILRINDGSNLTDMGMLEGLDSLHTLIVQQAYNLVNLAGAGDISPDLTALELNQSSNLEDIDSISTAPNLEYIALPGSSKLQSYTPLASLPNLKRLTVSPMYHVTPWKRNAWLTELTDYLGIDPPEPKVSIEGLDNLHNLESLTLVENGLLTDLSPLSGLQNLRKLDISYADMLEDIAPLGELVTLEHLDISGARALDDTTPLRELHNLEFLDISSCVNMSDYSFLENLTALKSLSMNNVRATNLDMLRLSGSNIHTFHSINLWGISNPAFLFDMKSLRILSLPRDSDQAFLEELSIEHPQLTALWLYRNDKLVDLHPLARLTRLEELAVSDCPNIIDYGPLGKLYRLRDMALIRQPVDNLDFVTPLEHLKSLRVIYGESLTDIYGLAAHSGLRNLELSGCTRLQDISPLGSMPMLADLNLEGCENLTDISPLSKAERLVALNLLDCNKIRKLAPLKDMEQLTWLWLRSHNLSPMQLKNLPDCRIVIRRSFTF